MSLLAFIFQSIGRILTYYTISLFIIVLMADFHTGERNYFIFFLIQSLLNTYPEILLVTFQQILAKWTREEKENLFNLYCNLLNWIRKAVWDRTSFLVLKTLGHSLYTGVNVVGVTLAIAITNSNLEKEGSILAHGLRLLSLMVGKSEQ